MVGDDSIRRRRPEKSFGRRTEDAGGTTPQGTVRLSLVIRLTITCLVSLSGYLVYVYSTSPTSAIVINDAHDVSKLEWANVNNDDLQHGRKVLTELVGPESIVVDDMGNWYTGVHDGRILKVTNGGSEKMKVIDVTAFSSYTSGKQRVRRRPLGLRLVGKNLYLADGYQGIFVIDIDTYKWDKIVGYDDVSPPLLFPDDLAISKGGNTMYFTDVSMRWMYHDLPYSVIEGECSGRVFEVDLGTKNVDTLRKGLCFPNGIELNREETVIAVSESNRRRIAILDIKTGKTMRHTLLPGGTDNIRPGKAGGYWVTLTAIHNPALDFMDYYPFVRDIVASILGVKGLYKLTNVNQGAVIKLDEEFQPVSIHYDREGKLCQALTEVQEYKKGHFLVGSFRASGIVILDGLGSA